MNRVENNKGEFVVAVGQLGSKERSICMGFEDIPEDKEEFHPCPEDCGGSVSKDSASGLWCCDTCDWSE